MDYGTKFDKVCEVGIKTTVQLVKITKCVQAWLTLIHAFIPQAHQLIVFIRSANPWEKKSVKAAKLQKHHFRLWRTELWIQGFRHRRSSTERLTQNWWGTFHHWPVLAYLFSCLFYYNDFPSCGRKGIKMKNFKNTQITSEILYLYL